MVFRVFPNINILFFKFAEYYMHNFYMVLGTYLLFIIQLYIILVIGIYNFV